jgi:hypothetical protein
MLKTNNPFARILIDLDLNIIKSGIKKIILEPMSFADV